MTLQFRRHVRLTRAYRRPFALLVGVVTLCGAALVVGPMPSASAATIAYPDLINIIPENEFVISHPTPTTKEFDYTHIVYNAGLGTLSVTPTNYNSTTNLATGVQNLYSYDASGNRTLQATHTAVDQFYFHTAHGHYHFPLASFGLFGVNPDGSMGQAVAMSPKNGFCLGDDIHLDANLPNSPHQKDWSATLCATPTDTRGISSGWGTHYDRVDPGQSIDVTNVPDGDYWFHSVVDPDNNFLESDKSNNTTDIKIHIQGDTITPVSPLVSQGRFVFDKSFLVDGQGALSTPSFSTSAPNELLVAVVTDRSAVTGQSATVTGGGLNWTLGSRSNTQSGTAEVWTAFAANQVSNAVVTATPALSGYQSSLSVYAVQGASGIGATATTNGATGSPGVSLTTTQPGSWVMAAGELPTAGLAPIPGPGELVTHNDQQPDVTSPSTGWTEAKPGPTAAAGTNVTFQATYPTAQPWNEVAFELVPFSSSDHTPPNVVGTPTVTNIGPDRATVNWTTDELSTSRVDYGPTTAYGSSTPTSPALLSQHSMLVTGLSPSTTYQFQVVSSDGSGNQGSSGPFSFQTTPPRTTPPVFSNVHIADLQPDQAIFAWTTDEVASSHVEYGLTNAYGTVSPEDSTLVTSHFDLVTGLKPATVYHYRVGGTDPYNNSGSSADFTFQTPAIPPPISVEATVSTNGTGTVTAGAFSASAGDIVVAFGASDGGLTPQSLTMSGAGLTWTLDERVNAEGGTSEIWHAKAPSALTNATVTSTETNGGYDQSLTVVAFKGAAGIGDVAGNYAPIGGPNATIGTVGAHSLVYAVGNDYEKPTARTLATDQTLVHEWSDTAAGDDYWVQRLTGDGGPVDSVIPMADTDPTTDMWNFAAVELVRPVSVPPPAAAAPQITAGPTVTNLGSGSATINWTTDQYSTSQVAYGTTSSYGSTTALDTTPLTAHSQTITGLTPGATYHYTVTSTNSIGPVSSSDLQFTTPNGVNQTITFGALPAATLAQSPVTVGATASSGLPVSFSTTTPSVCTSTGTNGATINLVATGTCTVQADQAGNGTYNPAPSVQQSFTVTSACSTGGCISVGDQAILEGDSGQRTMVFRVMLSQPATTKVTVHYAVTDGTAHGGIAAGSGVDYRQRSGTLTFTPNATTGKTPVSLAVGVVVYSDTTPEPNETLVLTLSNPTGGYAIGRGIATGTIVNDDGLVSGATAGVGDGSVSVTKSGNAALALPVTLSTKLATSVTISYTIVPASATWSVKATGGGDFGGKLTGTVSIAAGAVQKFVTIPIWPDANADTTESFTIKLNTVTGASLTLVRDTGTGTIIAP